LTAPAGWMRSRAAAKAVSERSIATTDPSRPTSSASSRETSPAPQPRSSTRIPRAMPALRSRRSVMGRKAWACTARRLIGRGVAESVCRFTHAGFQTVLRTRMRQSILASAIASRQVELGYSGNSDVQFGVTKALRGDFVRHDEPHPAPSNVGTPWYWLDHVYRMEAGEAVLARPPIKQPGGEGAVPRRSIPSSWPGKSAKCVFAPGRVIRNPGTVRPATCRLYP
jgi:hypothetical protein